MDNLGQNLGAARGYYGKPGKCEFSTEFSYWFLTSALSLVMRKVSHSQKTSITRNTKEHFMGALQTFQKTPKNTKLFFGKIT